MKKKNILTIEEIVKILEEQFPNVCAAKEKSQYEHGVAAGAIKVIEYINDIT